MTVYRITLKRWASSLQGSGYAGRWNSAGLRVIYTAENRSLACLENLAHRSGEGLSSIFSLATIHIPEQAKVTRVPTNSLPEDWFQAQGYAGCQRIGDAWLNQVDTLLLQVPSSLMPDETNMLINPLHKHFAGVKIRSITPFRFDPRLKD